MLVRWAARAHRAAGRTRRGPKPNQPTGDGRCGTMAAMASLADIVFDCARPAPLARFWAAVLDDYAVAPYDDAEIARLASLGITSTEDDPTVLVEPRAGGPRLWFQQVPEPKLTKNRVHLDVRAADRRAEVERLTALGASVWDDRASALTVMQDPEGNEFCVIDG